MHEKKEGQCMSNPGGITTDEELFLSINHKILLNKNFELHCSQF